MRKIYIVILVVAALLGFYFGVNLTSGKNLISPIVKNERTQRPTATPIQQKEVGIPKRIVISSLHLDSIVESVTVDADGNMDVPKEYNNTAWYSPGPKPGEYGSAVIDGHVDTPSGEMAVFANISKLKKGDSIKVIDDKEKEYTFVVSDVSTYELSEMPLNQIFSRQTLPMLNLITCAGVFDKSKKMYSHRTVVYSKLLDQL